MYIPLELITGIAGFCLGTLITTTLLISIGYNEHRKNNGT